MLLDDSLLTTLHVSDIDPHPDNPRKDLGDLEELKESIKKNGIMQNLTVVPVDEENPVKYVCLIGHRRLAAAKAAGLYQVPARIVFGLSHKDQVGIMLEENMQRNDLTIVEQAQGFQMMLDLGETEETIAEKTGFSRTTVRHRLQLAKLDQKNAATQELLSINKTALLVIACAHGAGDGSGMYGRRGKLEKESNYLDEQKRIYEILKLYGYKPDDEEKQMLDGTHELYIREE